MVCAIKLPFLAAPTVQLIFTAQQTISTAEKLREHILETFEVVLCSPMITEIRCETKKGSGSGVHVPLISSKLTILKWEQLLLHGTQIVEVDSLLW